MGLRNDRVRAAVRAFDRRSNDKADCVDRPLASLCPREPGIRGIVARSTGMRAPLPNHRACGSAMAVRIPVIRSRVSRMRPRIAWIRGAIDERHGRIRRMRVRMTECAAYPSPSRAPIPAMAIPLKTIRARSRRMHARISLMRTRISLICA
jgi:hypothetical protein